MKKPRPGLQLSAGVFLTIPAGIVLVSEGPKGFLKAGGGHWEPEDDLDDASIEVIAQRVACRELGEETGILLPLDRFTFVDVEDRDISRGPHQYFLFSARASMGEYESRKPPTQARMRTHLLTPEELKNLEQRVVPLHRGMFKRNNLWPA